MRYLLLLIPAIALAGQAHWSVIDGKISKLESFGGSVSGVEYVHDIPLRDGEVRHGAEWQPRIVTQRVETVTAIAPELQHGAELFRTVLRQHFGDGAESNRAVTAQAVAAHFVSKRFAGTITAEDLADAMLLNEWFATLSAWTGDGTTWSFPFAASAVTNINTVAMYQEPDL